MEQIIHLDFCADKSVIFAVGWTLSLVVDYYYKAVKSGPVESNQLLAIIKNDRDFFREKFPDNPEYIPVTDYLTELLQE